MLPLHRVVVLLLFVNPAARKESRRDNFLPGPFRDWIRLLCFADTVKPRRSWEKRSAHLAPSTLDSDGEGSRSQPQQFAQSMIRR